MIMPNCKSNNVCVDIIESSYGSSLMWFFYLVEATSCTPCFGDDLLTKQGEISAQCLSLYQEWLRRLVFDCPHIWFPLVVYRRKGRVMLRCFEFTRLLKVVGYTFKPVSSALLTPMVQN